MRCLYCGKQLALFRRLTGSGEFCSDAHKQSYHDEYNKLALTRLIAAQTKTDDARKPASTLQLASGDRQDAKALPEPLRTGLHERWGNLSTPKARMIEAPPPEAPPPPAATFLIRKPSVAQGSPVDPPATAIEAAASPSFSQKPTWSPVLAESQDPPLASLVQNRMLPSFAASIVSAPMVKVPDPLAAIVQPCHGISLGPRPVAGLQPRKAANIDLLEFAGRPQGMPEQSIRFEDFRFAVMLFGCPELDVLGETSPPELAAPETIDAGLWDSSEIVSTFANLQIHSAAPSEPSASRSLEALRMAAAPQLPSRNAMKARTPDPSRAQKTATEQPDASVGANLSNGAGDSSEKPRPKLPTIPATKRRSAPAMPSILQPPAEFEPEQSQSLWGSLRKYIKR